jgi:hypothetical protein
MQCKPRPEPRAWRASSRCAVAHPADGPPQSRAHLATADAATWPRSLLQGGQLDHGSVALASGRPERASRPTAGGPEERQNERYGGHALAVEVHLRLSSLMRKGCCNWRLTGQRESNVDEDEVFSTSRQPALVLSPLAASPWSQRLARVCTANPQVRLSSYCREICSGQ